MSLKINSIYEATIYKNGNSFYGKAEELTLPGIKPMLKDHQALALQGKLKLPTGFEDMQLKIKFNSLYEDTIADSMDIYKEQLMIVYGNLESWEGDAKTGEKQVKATMRGRIAENGALGIKYQDKSEMEEVYNLSAYKLEIDGIEILNLDIQANTYFVNGLDLWAQRRANLGLA